MTGLLDRKVIVLAGAGRGIGRAIALDAAQSGARVVVVDADVDISGVGQAAESSAQTVAEEICDRGGEAISLNADISRLVNAQEVVRTTIERFGRLDGMVCVAGVEGYGSIADTSEEDWERICRVNLGIHFACTQAAARVMSAQGSGRIIHFSSWGAISPNPAAAAYCAAKAGVMALTVSAARSLEADGVTVNCILPGAATRMTDAIYQRPAHSDRVTEVSDLTIPSSQAAGTWRDPHNISPAVLYLLSDRAASVTAQSFAVVGHQVTQVRYPTYGETVAGESRWSPETLGQRMDEAFEPIAPLGLDSWPPIPV